MSGAEVLDFGRDAIWITVLVAAGPMIVGLVVGLVVSLLQTLTQIQEQTLVFVPKILAIFFAILLFLPIMGGLPSTLALFSFWAFACIIRKFVGMARKGNLRLVGRIKHPSKILALKCRFCWFILCFQSTCITAYSKSFLGFIICTDKEISVLCTIFAHSGLL